MSGQTSHVNPKINKGQAAFRFFHSSRFFCRPPMLLKGMMMGMQDKKMAEVKCTTDLQRSKRP